jgi:hypothetical protein
MNYIYLLILPYIIALILIFISVVEAELLNRGYLEYLFDIGIIILIGWSIILICIIFIKLLLF